MPFDNPVTPQESDFTKKMRQAFALIDTPATWCKGASTRTVGRQVQYCSAGAMQMAFVSGVNPDFIPPNALIEYSAAMDVLLRQVPQGFATFSVPVYNDKITHQQLCEWWERAIEHSKTIVTVGA